MSTDNIWRDVQKRFRNSVVQIMSTSGEFNIPEPYFPPRTKEGRGSGFLITKEGHIITNAHVVSSLISVVFRSENVGNKNLPVNLIAICPAKDVALLKVQSDVLTELGDFEPMSFGDDHKLEQTQPVVAIGYPLGRERIKFTSGVISGYETLGEENSESSQSYIQIDAAINAGNSGGPLVSTDGKIVGINSAGIPSLFAQNTNFAIPSRVVLSILREMFSREGTDNPLVHPPSLGLSFQRVTIHHFEAAGIVDEEEQQGLRIREIIPGSPFTDTEDGSIEVSDILQVIEYADPYNISESFDVDTYRNNVCTRCNDKPDTFIEISRYANIKLKRNGNGVEEVELEFTRNRKVSLQEVLDTIPIDTRLTLQILRPVLGEVGEISAPFKSKKTQSIRKVYPPFDKLDYVIFGGAVWVPLSTNIIDAIGETRYLCKFIPFKNRDKPRVMITKIFPENDLRDIEAIDSTEILDSINGNKILTLDEMRKTLKDVYKSEEFVSIKMTSGKIAVLSVKISTKQDQEIHEKHHIKPDSFSINLWD